MTNDILKFKNKPYWRYLDYVGERTRVVISDAENFPKFFINQDVDEDYIKKIRNEKYPELKDINFFGFCEKLFDQFLISNHSNPKAEFFIPLVVDYIINKGDSRLKVLMSNSQWFGVTYKEDKKFVQRDIEKLKQKNVYPKKLW